MSETRKCPECGTDLPAADPQPICVACLLKRGLESNTTGFTEAKPTARWTPPQIKELAPRFPELEIRRLIGRGGMGAVYEARQKNLDRVVALKILPPEMARDPGFKERFAREAQAMARLNHPHVVTIYEFGEREGQGGGWYYFVMEFVDGLNLRGLLDSPPQGHISPKEALAIVPQICEALEYAHRQGIVHRDIKPENILLNKQGQVKIADFGLAKLMGRTPATPGMTEKVMGTPAYMAPEQTERPAEVDHRADIYSLGVVFYQMLTGELPVGRFEAPSKKVLIDVRLDEVVLRALEREPEKRYQQVSEVRTQVETIVQTGPMGASATSADAAPAASFAAQNKSPARLSRLAVVGALCPVMWFTHILGPVFIILPPVFGLLALLRIRRSEGRTYGLALALVEIFLLPCMLLARIFWDGFHLDPQRALALEVVTVVVLLPLLTYFAWRLLRLTAIIPQLPHGDAVVHSAPPPAPSPRSSHTAVLGAAWTILLHWLLIALFFTCLHWVPHVIETYRETKLTLPAATVYAWNFTQFVNSLGCFLVPAACALDATLCIFFAYLKIRPLRYLYSFAVILLVGGLTLLIAYAITLPRRAASAVAGGSHSLPLATPHLFIGDHSALIVEDGERLQYAIFYAGRFGNASEIQGMSTTGVEQGTLQLSNGRMFGYLREALTLNFLTVNGRRLDLAQGRVLMLHDDEGVEQLKLFPPLAKAKDVNLLEKLIASVPQP